MTRKQPELKTNVIICGDCEHRMKEHIPKESIDLIYLDPPFFSGTNYDLIWGKNGETKSKATIKVFEDAALYVKKCGECNRIWRKNPRGEFYKTCGTANCKGKLDGTKDVRMSDVSIFTEWLRPRLKECYRVLKLTGSIYCHLDYHAIHYVKVMMDEIFGYGRFQNEIIWQRTNAKGKSTNNFNINHDTILVYKKSDNNTFNIQFDEMVIPKNVKEDNNGMYVTQPVIVKSRGSKDKTRTIDGKVITLDDSHGWYWAQGTINEYESAGYIFEWSSNNIPRYKKYLNIGKPCDDIWCGMYLHPSAKERLGYATQKPEALLERIIKASSNPGDVILDPFCGCGTAIAVAQKLDRKWIGIDVEPLSCTVMQHRLANMDDHKVDPDIIDLKRTLTEREADDIIVQSDGMNGFDFQDWIIDIINGTPNSRRSGDRGVDGWIDESLTGKLLKFGTLENGDPIQVKMMDRIGGPIIRLFSGDMQDYSEHGVIIAYGFANTANKEVEIAHKKYGVEIELLTIRDILMLTDKEAVKRASKLPEGQEHLGSWN